MTKNFSSEKEFTGREYIVEAADVIAIAKSVIKNLPDISGGVSDVVARELKQALTNLDAAELYLDKIKKKYDTALMFVPADAQKQKML